MLSSQPDSRRILTYGRDETLLHTRRLLLEQAGYMVDTASTPGSFQSHLAGAKSPYSLLILCHTIATQEQHEISSGLSSETAVYLLKAPASPAVFLKQVANLVSTV
jgi:hypothetical protein